MALKLARLVILGAPASGKGTIASRIVKNFKIQHISSGDILRLNIKNKTELGLQVGKYIKDGKLVPDSIMINLIVSEIEKIDNTSWLLDGFPRTLSQAKELWVSKPLDLVVNLEVPFEVIVERARGRMIHLTSGRVYNTDFSAPKVAGKDDITGEDLVQREDDKPLVVMKRLRDYEIITNPVIKYYKEFGVLENFKGSTSDEIWPQVLDCLMSYMPKNKI